VDGLNICGSFDRDLLRTFELGLTTYSLVIESFDELIDDEIGSFV
jgi:hypothetical protein